MPPSSSKTLDFASEVRSQAVDMLELFLENSNDLGRRPKDRPLLIESIHLAAALKGCLQGPELSVMEIIWNMLDLALYQGLSLRPTALPIMQTAVTLVLKSIKAENSSEKLQLAQDMQQGCQALEQEKAAQCQQTPIAFPSPPPPGKAPLPSKPLVETQTAKMVPSKPSSEGSMRSRYQDFAHRPIGRTVLICDDDNDIRTILKGYIEESQCTVLEASDGTMALGMLALHPIDVLITDLRMPGTDGTEVIRTVRQLDENLPILVISGLAERRDIAALVRSGVTDFIDKPFNPEYIKLSVSRVLRERRMKAGITRLSQVVFQAYSDIQRSVTQLAQHQSTIHAPLENLSHSLREIETLTRYLLNPR